MLLFRARLMQLTYKETVNALLLQCQHECPAGQEAFDLHSKDTVNDSTYLLLSSLAVQSLRKANIIKALAINLNLARPEKPPGSFVSPSSKHTFAMRPHSSELSAATCFMNLNVVQNLLLVRT